MRAKYSLTEEDRKQLEPWAEKCIANAMSTKPMTDDERAKMRVAVRGLYEAANMEPPPDERIVFVPSPFVLRFAGGFAAAIWYLRNKKSMPTADATTAATRNATRAATDDATRAATYEATRAATTEATRAATTRPWGSDWWYGISPKAMRRLAARLVPECPDLLIMCAQSAWRMWNGGNQWSSWVGFISFFRYVAKLPLDYSKWQHYEDAALYAGPRIMHAKFCMISDRPTVLKVDDRDRPHCEDGPFCQWADGTKLYAWHGVRVPMYVIERPESITIERIEAEENVEVRRIMIEQFGYERFILESGAQLIHSDETGALYRKEIPGDEPLAAVHVVNSTPEPDGSHKKYMLRVPPTMERAREAVAWTFNMTESEYQPLIET